MKKKALILFSGGLDSTVALALALAEGRTCLALSFDYGQRHRCELIAANAIAAHYNIPHAIINLDPSVFKTSSLLSSGGSVPLGRSSAEIAAGGTPSTYVPARNTLFLAYATGIAEVEQCDEIHIGVNSVDAPGYPDCRESYIEAFQEVLNRATKQAADGSPPKLVTPLMFMTKEEIVRTGRDLNAPIDMSWSCYNPRNGVPCGECDACTLRTEAFL